MMCWNSAPERYGWVWCKAKRFVSIRALQVLILAAMPSLLLSARLYNPDSLRDLESRLYGTVNQLRHSEGIFPLTWNEQVAAEARRHASSMARNGFLSHRDPVRGDLADRLDSSGIAWRHCAENLYEEKGIDNPAERAVHEWMRSANHRKNLLNPDLVESGVGAAVRGDGTLVIVQDFVKR